MLIRHFKYYFCSTFIYCYVLTGCSSFKQISDQNNSSQTKGEQNRITRIFIDAVREKSLNNFDKAKEKFSRVLREDPSNAAAMYELSRIEMMYGNTKEGLTYAKGAANIDPQNKWYQSIFAEALMQKNKYKDAAKVFEILIEQYPNSFEYYLDLAYALSMAREYNAAIKVYDLLEKMIGVEEKIILKKQQLYLKMNKLDKAIAEINRLINTYPKEVKYYNLLAELYQVNGHSDKALETYEKALMSFPDDPNIHLSLADYYQRDGDRETYMKFLKKAFTNPDLKIDRKIKILLSYFTLIEKKPEIKNEPIELCEILITTHPQDAKSFAVYGDFLYHNDQPNDAIKQYINSTKLDNSRYTVWQQILLIYAELQQYDSLLLAADTVISYFPNQPVVFYLKGFASLQKKLFNESIKASEKGLEIAGDNKSLIAQLYANLGEAYYQVKEYEKSDSCFDQSIIYDPKNSLVLNNYSYYLSLRGERLEEAQKMSHEANLITPNNASYEDTYAWIIYKLKNYNAAKEWIEKSFSHGGDKRPVVVEHFGDILYQLGDIEKAVNHWENAKEIGGASKLIDKKIRDKKLYE